MFKSCSGFPNGFYVRLDLLKLLRQCIDLRDLVVDHLDVLREVDDVVCLRPRDRGRIDHDDLRAQERRTDEQSGEG